MSTFSFRFTYRLACTIALFLFTCTKTDIRIKWPGLHHIEWGCHYTPPCTASESKIFRISGTVILSPLPWLDHLFWQWLYCLSYKLILLLYDGIHFISFVCITCSIVFFLFILKTFYVALWKLRFRQMFMEYMNVLQVTQMQYFSER